MTSEARMGIWRGASVLVVWLAALVGGIAIACLAPRPEAFGWFAVAAGGCTLLAFALQLLMGRVEGYIARIAASAAGGLVILAVVSFVALAF